MNPKRLRITGPEDLTDAYDTMPFRCLNGSMPPKTPLNFVFKENDSHVSNGVGLKKDCIESIDDLNLDDWSEQQESILLMCYENELQKPITCTPMGPICLWAPPKPVLRSVHNTLLKMGWSISEKKMKKKLLELLAKNKKRRTMRKLEIDTNLSFLTDVQRDSPIIENAPLQSPFHF
ncbi:hypothetical protein POMI540_3377 [Schizosaccharomyces pombe]